MPGREAYKLNRLLEGTTFETEIEDLSRISYLPIKRGPSAAAIIIEDEAEAEKFCLKLVAAGCKVEDTES